MKALRDIALYNATKRSERAVLVTFDKRLLQAVRLVQSWNEPWADDLAVENCQTFWVWHLTDPTIADHPAANTLQEVMDNFRRKSRQLFGTSLSDDGDQSTHEEAPIWLTNRSTLDILLKRFGDGPDTLNTKSDDYQQELMEQIRGTLKQVELIERRTSRDSLEVIQKACRLFFKEVEELLPAFGLIVSDVFDREKILVEMLQKHGVRKVDFLDALNEEIQQHARTSLQILGASSLVAPKTIRAVYAFSEMDQVKTSISTICS